MGLLRKHVVHSLTLCRTERTLPVQSVIAVSLANNQLDPHQSLPFQNLLAGGIYPASTWSSHTDDDLAVPKHILKASPTEILP